MGLEAPPTPGWEEQFTVDIRASVTSQDFQTSPQTKISTLSAEILPKFKTIVS